MRRESTSSADIKIAAVDPGKMCGVALFQWVGTHQFFTSVELTPVSAAAYVERYLSEMSGWLVVAERYTPDQRRAMSFQPDTLEAIGMMRYVVERSPRLNQVFGLQSRADAKKLGGVRVLKKLGWHKITKDGHANAAASHVLLALLTHYPTDYAALMDEIQST